MLLIISNETFTLQCDVLLELSDDVCNLLLSVLDSFTGVELIDFCLPFEQRIGFQQKNANHILIEPFNNEMKPERLILKILFLLSLELGFEVDSLEKKIDNGIRYRYFLEEMYNKDIKKIIFSPMIRANWKNKKTDSIISSIIKGTECSKIKNNIKTI